jgi:ABC-type nickel/cobalt efflux system permease component RcnA
MRIWKRRINFLFFCIMDNNFSIGGKIMFENIGKKIQGVCKTIFVIQVAVILIIGMGVIMIGAEAQSYDDSVGLLCSVAGILIIIVGILISWLGQLRLYAYGKIAESCEYMMKSMERMENMQISQNPQNLERTCANCGEVLEDDAVYCPVCGARN